MPLTLDDVVQAKQVLEAAGKYASADKILARLGTGSKKTVLKFLRALAGAQQAPSAPAAMGPTPLRVPAPAMVPATAVEASPPTAPPPTLLTQAEAQLHAAWAAERAARLAREQPGSTTTWDDVARCTQATRQAQGELDHLQRGLAALRLALPEAERAVVVAEGELGIAHDVARKTIALAQRRVAQARQALQEMQAQLAALAGNPN